MTTETETPATDSRDSKIAEICAARGWGETHKDALRQALAQADSIVEMVAKLKAARERLPCFFQESGFFYRVEDDSDLADFESFKPDPDDADEIAPERPERWTREELDEEHGEGEWFEVAKRGDDEPDEDEAREEIEQDALSVEVRSDWHTPGDEDGCKPAEYAILLCTGGPAVRIRGGLDRGSVTSATLEFQGWFIPWCEVPGCLLSSEHDDAIEEYANCFYFGE